MTAVDGYRNKLVARDFPHSHNVSQGCVLLNVVYIFVSLGGWCVPPMFAAEPVAQSAAVTVNLLELPSSRQAQLILQADAKFFWEQTPLRVGLQELCQIHHISLWIDRQLDPMQLVTSPAIVDGQSSLHARLRQIATVMGAEMGLIENVVYFGPTGKATALQRVAAELHDAINRSDQRHSGQLRSWHWVELSNSAELLAQLSSQWQIEIVGEVPHDLFHAGELLEPCTLATQLTLLVGGFERQAEVAGLNQFVLKKLTQRGVWQADYRKADLDLRSLVRLRQQYEGSQCQTRGAVSTVRGVTDFHLALLASPATAAGGAARDQTARWGFEVQNTAVNAVMDKLAGSFGLTVQWDASCTAEMRSRLISFKVDQATTDELLAEVARVSDMKIIREKNQVLVKP